MAYTVIPAKIRTPSPLDALRQEHDDLAREFQTLQADHASKQALADGLSERVRALEAESRRQQTTISLMTALMAHQSIFELLLQAHPQLKQILRNNPIMPRNETETHAEPKPN